MSGLGQDESDRVDQTTSNGSSLLWHMVVGASMLGGVGAVYWCVYSVCVYKVGVRVCVGGWCAQLAGSDHPETRAARFAYTPRHRLPRLATVRVTR